VIARLENVRIGLAAARFLLAAAIASLLASSRGTRYGWSIFASPVASQPLA
jgi:hypothetical protein